MCIPFSSKEGEKQGMFRVSPTHRNMMADGSHDGTHDDDSEPGDDTVPPHSRRVDVSDEAEEDDAVGHVVMYLQERSVLVLHSQSWFVDMDVDASEEEAAHILFAREYIYLQNILYAVVQLVLAVAQVPEVSAVAQVIEAVQEEVMELAM
jgi:hypothetical protein